MDSSDQLVAALKDSGDPIDEFATRLLQDRGVTETLTSDTLAQMHSDLVQRLEKLTHKVAVEALNDQALEELEQKLDANISPPEMQQFFRDNIPDLSTRLAKAYYEFRILYLGAT